MTEQQITMNMPTRKVNMLSYAEMYKLLRYIEVNHGVLKGKTQDTIAKECSEKLGLTVTISNIRAASETLGIPLGLIAAKPAILPNEVSRILASALCDLYKRLGEEAPASVHAVANQ